MSDISKKDQLLMEDIWKDQGAPQAPYQDLTRVWPFEPVPAEQSAPQPEDLAREFCQALEWPEWVRFYAKPALAVVALSKLARSQGKAGGVIWDAPGTGAPLQSPQKNPGVVILRGDWAPDAPSMRHAQENARRGGRLLALDESSTGFRLATGGARQYFGLDSDIVIFGPMLAGGQTLGILVGRGDPPPESKALPSAQALAAVADMLPRLTEPGLADRLTDLGARLVEGLRYYIQITGQNGQVTVSGPPAMPRMEGKRLWAFINLAREEGLGLGPVLMPGLCLENDGMEHAWRRLARAAARLHILPEGQKGPQGWKEAFQPNSCPRVEDILAQFK